MARERRFGLALGRLRRRGVGSEATPEGSPPPEADAAGGPEASETDVDPPTGEQLSLGDLNEGRREALMSRLKVVRERAANPAPSAPAAGASPPAAAKKSTPPAEPAASAKPAAAEPDAPSKPKPGLRDRLSAGAHAVRLRAAGSGGAVAHRWGEIPKVVRQRIAAGGIVAAVAAIVIWVLIPAAPCSAPGGDSCPAEDSAIELVPADALAYAHVDIDPESDELAAAKDFAGQLRQLGSLALGSVSKIDGTPVNFATQIEPWAGDEAAIAVLPASLENPTVTMIEADDDDAAGEFAEGVVGEGSDQEVGGIDVNVGEDGRAYALLDGFLVIGGVDAVKSVIEDEGGSLSTAAVASGIDDLPEDRFAYAFLSGDGARLLAASDPAFSTLDTFVNSAGTSGVVASLGFEGGRASLSIRSDQDPELVGENPGFFSALPQFKPSLASDVGADALAYVGLGGPSTSVESLLSRAQVEAPGLARAYTDAENDLRKSGGVSISDDLLPLLGTQAALSIEPVAEEAATQTPGVIAPSGAPYVSLLAEGVDSKAAAEDLADLQAPLTEALAPSGGEAAGQVAVFEPLQIAGIEAQSLNVSSNVELTYATYDDRLVAATKPLGIAQARAGGNGLAQSPDYLGVTEGMPNEVSMIAYLDLRDLLSLGEELGLAADPAYARLAPDLRTLQAAAVAVDDSSDVVRTEINLTLGEPQAVAPITAVPGAE